MAISTWMGWSSRWSLIIEELSKSININDFCILGCNFNGRQYVDGAEFTLESDPCMTCLCHNTVMTCQQKKCFSACGDNAVSVPGQCCPACPSKSLELGGDYW